MRVVENVSLASMTTFGVGGAARRCIFAESEAEILEVVREADGRGEPLLIVGGGSNLVASDEGWATTVLRVASRGVEIGASDSEGRLVVTAAAGESWDAFVSAMVSEGLSGVECLAGIPGLVGAVPIQNVGAYGQDVGQTIVAVRAWDRARGCVVELGPAELAFGYRTSVFRASAVGARPSHVVLSVTFALTRSAESQPVRYAELARALAIEEGQRAPLARTRDTVVALRRAKGMVVDPTDRDTASAGSFFTNPVLHADALADLRRRVSERGVEGSLPVFPEPDGRAKVSAAWLIERAGFRKGYALGAVAISHKHALALTNRGGATAADVVRLARAIREGVHACFGVTLEPEPILVGIAL